jgi:hypothetical protein
MSGHPEPEIEISLQARTFADLQVLLSRRTLTLDRGLYAVGLHCSIRARVVENTDETQLHAWLNAFQPELVHWNDLRAVVHSSREGGQVVAMPVPLLFDTGGAGTCLLPRFRAASWTIAVARSCVVAVHPATGAGWPTLPTLLRRSADSGPRQSLGWEASIDQRGVLMTASVDGRVRAHAFREGGRVTLAFEASGDFAGCSVSWVLGLGDVIDAYNRDELKPVGDGRWRTEPISVGLSFDRQLYFEIVPNRP